MKEPLQVWCWKIPIQFEFLALPVTISCAATMAPKNDQPRAFQDAYRRLKANDPDLKKVNLQDLKLTDRSAQQLAKVIWKNQHLENLNLSKNKIGDLGAWELSEALKLNKTLKICDLRNNTFGVNGGAAVAEALQKNRTIERIIVDSNAFDGEAGKKALIGALKANSTLWHGNISSEKLMFLGNNSGLATACRRLAKNDKSLKFLNIMKRSLGNAHVMALAEALNYNRSLMNLNLWDNKIQDSGIVSLAAVLGKGKIPLENLSLRCNQIKDKGAIALAKAFAGNKKLLSLDLRENQIGDIGSKSLAQNLQQHPTLQELMLTDNKVGDDGAVALGAMYGVCGLKMIHLGNNSIGDQGAIAIAEGMKANSSVSELFLSNNKISDKGALAIAAAIPRNHALIRLYLSNKAMTKRGEKALEDSSESNQFMKCLYVTSGNLAQPGGTKTDDKSAPKRNKSFPKVEATPQAARAAQNGMPTAASLFRASLKGPL